MNRPGLRPQDGGPMVESYLAEVTARLPGPARIHAEIVAELRSGLAVAPGMLSPLPIVLAAAASLARLTLATRAAHRCLAIRAALT